MKTLRWGVLSTARIAQTRLIPAIQSSALGEVVAIASRDAASAQAVAGQFGIPRAHGSYEALLADPDVDAIYNPLPNHLHVPWSIKALEAGKHVLCEKPLGVNQADAARLQEAAAQHPHLKVMEAFMYRFHPQWSLIRQKLAGGELGQLRSLVAFFAYNNRDPDNVRNFPEMGGGGLLDIGCYPVSAARWLYCGEPLRVLAHLQYLPGYSVDCITTAILEFADGTASFIVSTKTEPDQWLEINGEKGKLRVERPFNPEPGRTGKVHLTLNERTEEHDFSAGEQYREMVDAFCHSVLNDEPLPTPLDDALANMRVLDALFTSAETGQWVELA